LALESKEQLFNGKKVFSFKTSLKHDIWYNEPQVMFAFFFLRIWRDWPNSYVLYFFHSKEARI
jgi:hypothetical protein